MTGGKPVEKLSPFKGERVSGGKRPRMLLPSMAFIGQHHSNIRQCTNPGHFLDSCDLVPPTLGDFLLFLLWDLLLPNTRTNTRG